MEHPMLKIDESKFTQEFNLSIVLGKIALGIVSALVVRYAINKIDAFTVKGKK
jgi:hypothetical protein